MLELVIKMDLPKRKPTRLKGYDYSTTGAYFVTICTKNRAPILSSIFVGEGLCALPENHLSAIGYIVKESICYLQQHHAHIEIDNYVIMPNHIHLLLKIQNTGGHGGPPLQNLIQQFKSYTTNQYGKALWQRSFHDHIIRGEADYLKIWNYIENNPAGWEKDCFYVE